MLFYLALILFISSAVCGIVLLMVIRTVRPAQLKLAVAVHAFLLLFWLLSYFLFRNSNAQKENFLFTLFLCSGIVICGVVWRTRVPAILKIYFSLFAILLPMFIFSPSMLMNFLVTGKYSGSSGKIFHLKDNYFLEEQSMFIRDHKNPKFKMTRKNGFFHKVIFRDIVLHAEPDSVHVLSFSEGDEMNLRIFTSQVNLVESNLDSVDITVPLVVKRKNDIDWHL